MRRLRHLALGPCLAALALGGACKRASRTIAPDLAPSTPTMPSARAPTGETEATLLDDQGLHYGPLPPKPFAACRRPATIGWGLFDVRVDDSGTPVGTVHVADHEGLSEEERRCVSAAIRTPPPSGGAARHLVYVAFR